jgi:hypothetical protein
VRSSTTGNLPLAEEHPELFETAVDLRRRVENLSTSLYGVEDGSVWAHHVQWTDRAGQLAQHLGAAHELADTRRYATGLAVLRTALEQCCLDELLLLADRYLEHYSTDQVTVKAWHVELQAKSENWTQNVVSFTPTTKGVDVVRHGHDVRNPDGIVVEHVSPYYQAVQDHDAIFGSPADQDEIAEAFVESDQLKPRQSETATCTGSTRVGAASERTSYSMTDSTNVTALAWRSITASFRPSTTARSRVISCSPITETAGLPGALGITSSVNLPCSTRSPSQ